MLTSLKRLAYAGLFLLPLSALPLQAQSGGTTQFITSPTAEGTKIVNVATATYTDANQNTYAALKDSATIMVGFLAAPNPSGLLVVTPSSPTDSAGKDTVSFLITNSGNGWDKFTVGVVMDSSLTLLAYSYNGVEYASLAALNAAVKVDSVVAGDTLLHRVLVIYTVNGSSGGLTLPITLSAVSERTPATSYSWLTKVQPPIVKAVAVTLKNDTTYKLPSNGKPPYTYSYTVKNTGNSSNSFSLSLTGTPNTDVTGYSITNGSSTGSLAPGATYSSSIQYSVLDSVPGILSLTATSGTASDAGDVTVIVKHPALVLAKAAYKTKASATALTATAMDAVTPADTFYYKLTLTNSNTFNADSAQIVDVLPSSLTYLSSSADVAADWTITPVSVTSGTPAVTTTTVTAKLNKPVTSTTPRFIWIAVKITTDSVTRLP